MKRASRFDARRLLSVMDGVAHGAGSALGGGREVQDARREVERAAYPEIGSRRPRLALKQSKD